MLLVCHVAKNQVLESKLQVVSHYCRRLVPKPIDYIQPTLQQSTFVFNCIVPCFYDVEHCTDFLSVKIGKVVVQHSRILGVKYVPYFEVRKIRLYQRYSAAVCDA